MRATRTAAFYEKEILKYPVGFDAVRNGVILATSVVANADARLIVETGTVMCYVNNAAPTTSKLRPAAASGETAADVAGILHHTIEFFGNTAVSYDEPCSIFFWNCIFDISKLVNYSGNAAAVIAAMPSCKFE